MCLLYKTHFLLKCCFFVWKMIQLLQILILYWGNIMAKETIQNIREAELKAKELVKDAETQKASILEQAKADGAAIKKEILDEAAKRAKAAVDEVEQTREKVLEVAGLQAENIIAQFREKAKGKREEAINLVISEIA